MIIITTRNNVYVNVSKIIFDALGTATLHYEDGTLHTIATVVLVSIEADK